MNEKKLTFEEKLDIIKNCPDEEIEFLTPQQKLIARKIKEGAKIQDIIEILKCSKQNIYQKIDAMAHRLSDASEKENKKKPRPILKSKKPSKSIERFDFGKFSDLSVLSKREKQVVSFHMQNPTLTYREIGERLEISSSTVGALLCNAKKKLSGDWEKTQRYHREYAKEHHKQNREKALKYMKEYHEKNREKSLEDMRKYNKEYYIKNREKIKKQTKEYRQKHLKES